MAGPSTPKADGSASPTAPTPTPSATPVEKAEPKETPKSKINITKTSSPALENPFAQLGARPSNGTSTPTVRSPSLAGSLKRPRAESDGQNAPKSAPKKATPISSDESITDYENRTLSSIFRITLDPNEKFNAANHRLIYLPNLRHELEDEALPLMLTKERLDSAIVEAASTIPHTKSILDYLLPCWKRVTKALKNLRGYANAKDVILKEAKRMCMSNCIFAAEVPELFGCVDSSHQNFHEA